MAMVNLSIGFDMADNRDPAGMCILYRDENKVSHIQNMVVGEKAELIYRLLTTAAGEYNVYNFENVDEVIISFNKDQTEE